MLIDRLGVVEPDHIVCATLNYKEAIAHNITAY